MVLRRGTSTARSSRSLDAIVTEHRAVLDRVEAGDAAGAAAAMRAHVLHTAELLIAQEAGTPPGAVDVDLGWTSADGTDQQVRTD
jgi:DNA-binding GntR family transcriptional regulator